MFEVKSSVLLFLGFPALVGLFLGCFWGCFSVFARVLGFFSVCGVLRALRALRVLRVLRVFRSFRVFGVFRSWGLGCRV